ncbi:MAG TPA: recombinase family protein [Hyalangium sp.]|jgi:DNA invertase Pin-like site-specific DNA recombinase|nr:recombinase family protein [Hyalangium sp.]
MSTSGSVVAGCYLRVSTQDQNPEHQRAEMEKICAARGWQPRWYEEKMKGTRNDRPEFARLISDALTGQLTAVVVWALDRMARDQVFMLTQFQALEQAGVKVVSHAERWTESDDDQKPLMLGVASGLAAAELRRLSRRSRAAHETARKNGKHIGRPFKNLSLLQEAARHVISGNGECSLREAVRRVNNGLPRKPGQPGGLCQISLASLRRYLNGTWEGQGAPAKPTEHLRRQPEKARSHRRSKAAP